LSNPIKCKYCHIVTLEGFNETERKYYEQGTKQLHTRERCQEAKNRAGVGSTPTPTLQDQKTNDIKAAQKERRIQHGQLITAMANLTKVIVLDIAERRGVSAASLEEQIGFEQYRQDEPDYMDQVV
jgi:hypothetical protein